jgi:hypothetical protein
MDLTLRGSRQSIDDYLAVIFEASCIRLGSRPLDASYAKVEVARDSGIRPPAPQ